MEDWLTSQQKLLAKEASLSSTCIGEGLTTIRKANLTSPGKYYQGFFLLAIGIERLLKLVIITHYHLRHDSFPKNSFLKSIGHDIKALINAVHSFESKVHEEIFEDELLIDIVSFISKFAKYSRYYNLDALTGLNGVGDPLIEWAGVQSKIKSRHNLNKETAYNPFNDVQTNIMVRLHDEKGSPISTLSELYEHSKAINKVQGYSVYYFWKIINYGVCRLSDYENQRPNGLALREFFTNYVGDSWKQKDIIKIKNWNSIK